MWYSVFSNTVGNKDDQVSHDSKEMRMEKSKEQVVLYANKDEWI